MDTIKKTILVVEDDKSLLKVLEDKLDLEHFNILEAKNGEEGLAIALKERPDLILLDIIMPVMDGIAMLRQLREVNDWSKQVPVILLTNVVADNDITESVAKYQPAYYLVKSNNALDAVINKIKECLHIT